MDCEPGDSSVADTLMNCSMSCCHDPSSSFVAAIVFVVPAPASAKCAMVSLPVNPLLRQHNISRTCDPVSPPPRTSAVPA